MLGTKTIIEEFGHCFGEEVVIEWGQGYVCS
jgi:hypothetical protein